MNLRVIRIGYKRAYEFSDFMRLDREEKAEYYSDLIEEEWNKMTKEFDRLF